MNRSPLWQAAFRSSTCIPFAFDKATHDHVLNMAAMWMWPALAPHVRDLMRKEDRNRKS